MAKKFDGVTLKQAKKFLRENWEEGIDCPCCTQNVKLYKRPFHSSMARVLIIIANTPPTPDNWVHVENRLVDVKSTIKGVHGKLKYWDMLEVHPNDDESKASSGLWRLTEKGWAFVKGETSTYKNLWTFKDHVYRRSFEEIDIYDALGKQFNYKELMEGRA